MHQITLEETIKFSIYSLVNPKGRYEYVEVGNILLELQNRFGTSWFQPVQASRHISETYGIPMQSISYASFAKAGYLDTAHQQTERWKPKKYYYKVKGEKLRSYKAKKGKF